MACQNQNPTDFENIELIICNQVFECSLTSTGNNSYELTCTPCCTPTAYFDVARISTRENDCNNINYYQAFINTDPVEIIQDCNLERIIRRCIEYYFKNFTCPTCNTTTKRCSLFGI